MTAEQFENLNSRLQLIEHQMNIVMERQNQLFAQMEYMSPALNAAQNLVPIGPGVWPPEETTFAKILEGLGLEGVDQIIVMVDEPEDETNG